MADPIVSPPTLAGFIAWSRVIMGVPTTAIADTDPGYAFAFQIAQDFVPCSLGSADIYTLCVYNWGGSVLLQFQQDYPGQKWFLDARKGYGINNFTPGVVQTASDVSTAETLAVGAGLRNLQLIDLQRISDPYGRTALSFMQSIGTLWGLN